MPSASEARFVELRGGLVLPAEPVLLVFNLEARGFVLRPDGADLLVSPGAQLTSDDRRAIRRWKAHILAVLHYEAPTCA